MGTTSEHTLGVSAFFTPWLPEDEDGLAPWIRAGVEDVLRDDTRSKQTIDLHADAPPRSNTLPNLSRLNLTAERLANGSGDQNTTDNTNGTLATYLTDLNLRQQTIEQAAHNANYGTAIKMVVADSSKDITCTVAITNPTLIRGDASKNITSPLVYSPMGSNLVTNDERSTAGNGTSATDGSTLSDSADSFSLACLITSEPLLASTKTDSTLTH